MKSLDRTLIEKAGYDNGFEIAENGVDTGNYPSVVNLYSSIHAIKVNITCGVHDSSYVLEFSDNLSLAELKRGLNKEIFLNDKIEVWDRELLGIVLKRAAELGVSLPDAPIRLYHEHLDEYLQKNPEESSFFNETSKSMFKGTEREQLVK